MSESLAGAAPAAGSLPADVPPEPVPLRHGAELGAVRGRGHGRLTRWSGGSRMIAVTSERLAMAEYPAAAGGYLPAIPADGEDRSLD